MSDDVNILSDEMLLQICRVSQKDLEETPALGDELRLARRLIPPPRARHDGRLEHAVTLLASAMGRMQQYNPTHLPFGFQGPTVTSCGWIDRDDLELLAKQIVGLTWVNSDPDDVACVVGQAVSTAVRLSLVEQKEYDAWRPGMASGSGWRSAVSATTYGVAKARSLSERQTDAAVKPSVPSPPVQRPAQNPPWARPVAQPDSRSTVDASASQRSVPVSWQDAPAPHLPSGMEPFDKALAEMLLRLPTMWASVDFERLTNTQEKALARLVEAGLVEERVVATAWMDGFPQVAILRGRVTGDFKRKLLWESVQSVPEWLTKDGKTRGKYSFWYDVTEVRLTEAGETARHDWNSPKPSFVLAIVRGIGGPTRGISPDGIVKIEERKVETREKPPAPSDVRALLREGFALNRVPSSDEVDAGMATAAVQHDADEAESAEQSLDDLRRRYAIVPLEPVEVDDAQREMLRRGVLSLTLSETHKVAELWDGLSIDLANGGPVLFDSQDKATQEWLAKGRPLETLEFLPMSLLEQVTAQIGLLAEALEVDPDSMEQYAYGLVHGSDQNGKLKEPAYYALNQLYRRLSLADERARVAGKKPEEYTVAELIGCVPAAAGNGKPASAGKPSGDQRLRKRAERAANIEALTKELVEHINSAKDHAYTLEQNNKEPVLLPRPNQRELAQRVDISEAAASRCFNDPCAHQLRMLFQMAGDLGSVMKFGRKK